MSRRAPIIVGVAFVLVAGMAVAFLVAPKAREVREARDRLQESEAQELVLEARLSMLEEAAEDAPLYEKRLERFQESVPAEAQLPDLINMLQDAADGAEVDFFAITPGTPAVVPQGGAAEIPSQIQVIGSFHPVDQFLYRLETLERVSKVVAMEVAAGPDGLPQIDMKLEARFFTMDLAAGPGAAPAQGTGETVAGTASGTAGVEASPSPAASPIEGG